MSNISPTDKHFAPGVIISAFSENHAGIQSQDKINRQIIWHLLLHPGKLAIPDSFIFTEPFLSHWMQGDSPLQLAMDLNRTKILVRDANIDGFSKYREYLADFGLGTAERPEMIALANHLQGWSAYNDWVSWPNDDRGDMAESYRDIITNNLLAENEKINEKVRFAVDGRYFVMEIDGIKEIVKGALARADSEGRNDLRYSDITHTIGLMCFEKTGILPAPDIEKLIKKQRPKIINKETIRQLLAIAGTIYDVNFSDRFNLPVQKMTYPEWINLFCELPKTSTNKQETGLLHSFTIDLPNSLFIDNICLKDLEKLLESRSNYDEAYQKILSDEEISNDDLKKLIEESIKEYCARISEFADGRTSTFRMLIGDLPHDNLEKILQLSEWGRKIIGVTMGSPGAMVGLIKPTHGTGKRLIRIIKMEKHADLEFFVDGFTRMKIR